jgi:hypothetical protein
LILGFLLFLYSCKPAIIYINISRAQIKRTKNAFTLILSISHIYSELLEDGTGIFEVIQEELSILTAYGVFRVTSPQTMARRDCFPAGFGFEQAQEFGFEHKFQVTRPQLKTLRAKL